MKRTRFAPSPTGTMHFGSYRTLVLNFLFAKKENAEFVLRIDDTDRERSKEEYTTKIFDTLQAMHITYDKTFKQSDRMDIYEKHFNLLKEKGYIYECFETPEEIERIQTSKRRRKIAPIFTRQDRCITTGESYWRFEIAEKITFKDNIFGEKTYNRDWSDPVIKKPNGDFTYTFASVVDDIEEKITHIIRGADHLTNGVVQQHLGNMILGRKWEVEFYHFPMLTMGHKKLSKRDMDENIDLSSLYLPGLIGFFARFGTNKKPIASLDYDFIAKEFEIHSLGKNSLEAPTMQDMLNHNRKIIQLIDHKEIEALNINRNIWCCFVENINTIGEIYPIQDRVQAMDLNNIDFLKDFTLDDIGDIDNAITKYTTTHNTETNHFLKTVREMILGDKPGPKSHDIIIMLLKLKYKI